MRWYPLIFFAVLAALLTVGLALVTRTTSQALEQQAILEQQNRARTVALEFDQNALLWEQLADSTASLAPSARTRPQVEELLRRLLDSAPADSVYGIGIWYEPYRFEPDVRLFGPYVHRGLGAPGSAVVTYEWSTPEYNYPGHFWYRLGRSALARPAFTEPYFDVDLTYLSTVRAIRDASGAVIGVVSVDTVLPQLQQIIERANTSHEESIYVTTASGALFAYPDEVQLLTWSQAHGHLSSSLLDLTQADLQAFRADRHAPKAVESVVPTQLGWQVHISTAAARLFAAQERLVRTALALGALLWALFLAMAVAHLRSQQARTLEREAEAALRAEALLKESVRMRDQFLEVASHELKTPLTPLQTRLQLIVNQLHAGKPVDPSLADKAMAAAQRLTSLINDLLASAPGQEGRLSFKMGPLSLNILLRAVHTTFATPGLRHRLELELPEDELWVNGDRMRLEQVITNLMTNAVKYTPEGGAISLKLRSRNGAALIAISDQGIGIPRDEQARIFDRYFRSRNAPSTSYGGLGLGLHIALDIIERHGGKIWVESEEGRGSTFFVSLPLLEKAPPSASPSAPATV